MIGAATCIHGYVARDGLGITLIKNQMVDMIPSKKNNKAEGKRLAFIQSLTLLNFPFSFEMSNLFLLFIFPIGNFMFLTIFFGRFASPPTG